MGIGERACRVIGKRDSYVVLLGEEQKCVEIIPTEMTVRLYKDIVLSRCKAYNATALLAFTRTVLEKYYAHRLRSFANSRE